MTFLQSQTVNKGVKKTEIFSTEEFKKNRCHVDEQMFVPVFDFSDHFQFACRECKEVANVRHVELLEFGQDRPILFFLKCPACGKEGVKKIYVATPLKTNLLYPTETARLSVVKRKKKRKSSTDASEKTRES